MGSRHETRKQQLIAELAGARQMVLAAALALGPGDQDVPFLGVWSAHDIVAHLAGWDYANLEALGAIRAGRLPAFYDHYDRDWESFNAALVAQHKQKTLEETAVLAQASHQALLAALTALPAEDLIRDYGVRSGKRRVTIAMLLTVEARDELKHAAQIRDFAQQGPDPATMP